MLENERKFEVKIFNQEKFELIELIVIAPDHHGLFSKISGIVSSCGFDIVTAKIFTRTDGFALDTLLIQNKENKIIFEKRIQENLIKYAFNLHEKGDFDGACQSYQDFLNQSK